MVLWWLLWLWPMAASDASRAKVEQWQSRDYAALGIAADEQRAQRLAVLVGHPRSGTTLLNAVLDAHPRMLFANEFDVVKHANIAARHELLREIALRSRDAHDAARVWTNYTYLGACV